MGGGEEQREMERDEGERYRERMGKAEGDRENMCRCKFKIDHHNRTKLPLRYSCSKTTNRIHAF